MHLSESELSTRRGKCKTERGSIPLGFMNSNFVQVAAIVRVVRVVRDRVVSG